MKKLLSLTAIVMVATTPFFAQQKEESGVITANESQTEAADLEKLLCTKNEFNLGTVSFRSEAVVEVRGNGVAQLWSDVVKATGCKKETFDGGVATTKENPVSYNADCRSNSEKTYGDLFSFCAVVRYHKELCTNGWRVPSREDFINLDKALGGTGTRITSRREKAVSDLALKYYKLFGFDFGAYKSYSSEAPSPGFIFNSGQNLMVFYWSLSPGYKGNKGAPLIYATNRVEPEGTFFAEKDAGMMVRCVKDLEK